MAKVEEARPSLGDMSQLLADESRGSSLGDPGLPHTAVVEPPDIFAPPPPAPDIDKAVAAEARKFLSAALAECRRLGIIPRVHRRNRLQRYDGPWPPYYAWYDIADRDAMAAAFVAALRAAYPARFGEVSKFPYKDPEQYVRAFLSAVIAQGTIQERRVAARSPATTAMLHELHRSVTQDGQTFGVLWLIGDVDFDAVDRQKVGDISLLRPSNPPEFLVSRLLPGALWAHDHGYPMPGAKHTGLLWARGTGSSHHWDVTTPINNGMGRLMQTLRLATAATSVERMVWLGEPSMIHAQYPEAWPQAEGAWETHWRRVGHLTPDDLPGLNRLAATVDRLELP